jgi:hypothetical protein
MSVYSDYFMRTHYHDSVYSVPTDIQGGTFAAAGSAAALQARASGSKHKVNTDRQRCAERPWHHMCTLHIWKTVSHMEDTCGRQSTHVEDSLQWWKTVYTCGRQSTLVEDSLQFSFDERQAHIQSDEAPFQFWNEQDATW